MRNEQDTASTRRAIDRTERAVRRQLSGMDCRSYDVGVRESVSGRMHQLVADKDDIDHQLSYLKHKNAKGCDIYIRPEGSSGLVLVDDLEAQAIRQMVLAGHSPSVVVETSPKNLQAWVRVAKEPVPKDVATEVGRQLASSYGGDPNAADW